MNATEHHSDDVERLLNKRWTRIRRTPVLPAPEVGQPPSLEMRLTTSQPRLSYSMKRISIEPRNRILAASLTLTVAVAVPCWRASLLGPLSAFAGVKAQLQQATSIQMTLAMSTPVSGTANAIGTYGSRCPSRPRFIRTEMDGGVISIMDIPPQKMLVLDSQQEGGAAAGYGHSHDRTNLPQNHAGARVILDGSERPLGERMIDQGPQGFCVTRTPVSWEIWVDKASGEIAMSKSTSHLTGAPIPNVIMRDIRLNGSGPIPLFSLATPAGYTVNEQAMNMTNPPRWT